LIDVKRTYFDACIYEFKVDFDSTQVKSYLKNFVFKRDTMLTTFLEVEEILKEPELKDFNEYINNIVVSFSTNILKLHSPEINRSWFQVYDDKSHHQLHIHDTFENRYALIYYLQATEKSSPTTFYMPGHPYIGCKEIEVSAETNKIVIFNSFIPHEVLRNTDNERLIFSCNFKLDENNTV
tara:strand:+ start:9378 stop:9920 length:543 start_codon:yes stop_codon:yes gene_type:complete